MKLFTIVFCLLPFTIMAAANKCSQYEKDVFKLVDEATSFQNTNAFAKYGWSKAGPTNGWLSRFQAIQDNNEDLDFYRKYNFFIADVYQVADEYRTEGSLDAFFQETEGFIKTAPRCD